MQYTNYDTFYKENETQILQSAIQSINPTLLNYDEFIRLAGALKAQGYSLDVLTEIAKKDPRNKGTLYKKWPGISGTGRHGQAGKGTIYDYAKRSGWKWPTPAKDIKYPARDIEQNKPGDNKNNIQDNFKIVYIIDNTEYKQKPFGRQIAAIRSREKIPTTPQYTPINAFINAIGKGQTFYPTIYNKEPYQDQNGNTRYTYTPIMQQLFVVDIDNDEEIKDENGQPIKDNNGKIKKRRIKNYLTIENALNICRQNNIMPFCIYETFSSAKHREDLKEPYKKFRLCFTLDKPAQVQDIGKNGLDKLNNYFISLFGPAADPQIKDYARMIFGTNEKDTIQTFNAVLSLEEIIKQANNLQQAAGEQQNKELIDIETLEKERAGHYSLTFFEDIKQQGETEIHTGFNSLDNILLGGLYPGLYNIGAISSLGKTSLILQIADNIAKQGRHVLYFSLEMSRLELIAKSISRQSAINLQDNGQDIAGAFTTRDILNPGKHLLFTEEQRKNLLQSKAAYDEYSNNLFIIDGVKRDKDGRIKQTGTRDILDRIKAHIAVYGQENKPIVFIDYLQILAPYDIHYTDKMNIDHNMLDLKQITKELNITIIAINSFNRDSYYTPIGLTSFKESGAIEYGSDVLIGLQYKGMEYKENETDKAYQARIKKLILEQKEKGKQGQAQEIELKILKDRNGYTSNCYLYFYPKYSLYSEQNITDLQQDNYLSGQFEYMPINDFLSKV